MKSFMVPSPVVPSVVVAAEVDGVSVVLPRVHQQRAGTLGQTHRDKTRVQMPAKMFPHLKFMFAVYGPHSWS